MDSPFKVVFLIPTRNRSELALRAFKSASAAANPVVQLVVSDNSTDDAEANALKLGLDRLEGGVSYMRPPEPMEMTTHWNWAFEEVLRRHKPTHIGVLTDRMVVANAEAMDQLVEIVRRHQDVAVTFNIDTFNDIEKPYWLRRKSCQGGVSKIASSEFIQRSARGVVDYSLPRLLNCVVPVTCMLRVKKGFGNFCISRAPDYAFAYRYVCVNPECVTWDYAPIIQYSLQRSNGLSLARGKFDSPDAQDFIRQSGGKLTYPYTPIPEILSVNNGCLNEYGLVQSHPLGKSFPPIELDGYLRVMCRDIALVEITQLRAELVEGIQRRGFSSYWRRYGLMRQLRYSLRRWMAGRFQPLIVLWLRVVKKRRFYQDIDEALSELSTPAATNRL